MDGGADGLAHELDVVGGGSGGGEPCGGFDELGAGVFGDLAEADFVGVAVVAGFEDDLEGDAGDGLADGFDVGFDVAPAVRGGGGEIDDHVEFGGALVDGDAGLGGVGLGGVGAVGEVDDGGDGDGRVGQEVGGEEDVGGLDADGGDAVLQGDLAGGGEVGVGVGGFEDGVVDDLGELVLCEHDCASVCGVAVLGR